MTDELYRDVPCPHTVTLPVLGVETLFSTNAPGVLAAIEQCYGAWRAIADSSDLVSPSAAEVKIVLQEGRGGDSDARGFTYRVPDPTRLMVSAPSSFGVADTIRLQSIAYVDASLVARPAALIEGVLEPLTLFLLGALDRQPVHGAAIQRGDIALVLAGPSGVGKTTLTYAAQRHGFMVLGDEPVYVQMEPDLRVWCRTSPIRPSPGARAHFPELGGLQATTLPNGKTKILVEAGDPAHRHADRVGLCLLRRGEGATPELAQLTPAQAADDVTSRPEQGYDLYAATLRDRIIRVAQRGAWGLAVAGTPHDLIPFLQQMFDQLERAP